MGILIIGCGAMGSAIAHGLSKSQQPLTVYDRNPKKREILSKEYSNVSACDTLSEGMAANSVLLLAIKPQDFDQAVEECKDFSGLIVSVLMGVSISRLKTAFPGRDVLRTMPNMAVQYGKGMVALAQDPLLADLKPKIEKTFSGLGSLYWLPEEKFDAVTALAGSGPAFVFALIESMVDAAIAMGFSAKEGIELATDMVGGAVAMLERSSLPPSELRWSVCSPKGGTIAGLRAFEKHGVRSAMIETFLATQKCSEDLERQMSK